MLLALDKGGLELSPIGQSTPGAYTAYRQAGNNIAQACGLVVLDPLKARSTQEEVFVL